MKLALKFARTTEDGKWKWAKSPGNGVRNAYLQCNAHKDCGRMLQVKKVDGLFCISYRGEHSIIPTFGKRKNSILSWEDDAALTTEGALFTGSTQVHWLSQLVQMQHKFVLHADGKHKLHHGQWILLTCGTHHLRYDTHHYTLSTQFVPLVYLFCKQHESDGACLMLLKGLQALAAKYFPNDDLLPGAVMSDHSDAFRNAYASVFPDAPFGQCWPHIIRKFVEGEYCSKTWAHFEDVKGHLQEMHLARSAEMRDLLTRNFGALWDSWGTQMN